jgi:hypothetical protein
MRISLSGENPNKYTDPDGELSKTLPFENMERPHIEIQRGNGTDAFNDTFTIFDSSGKAIYSQTVHSEISMTKQQNDDFILPAGRYNAKLFNGSPTYSLSLQISSGSVINPGTGEKGTNTRHLIHPNEITNPSMRQQRSANGKSNGPFTTPQSLGCILFKNENEFNEMWDKLKEVGMDIGSTLPMIIKDPHKE